MSAERPDDGYLGGYADWMDHRRETARLWPVREPRELRALIEEEWGVPDATPASPVRVIDRWTADGLDGRELAWSVGFGPETRAWVIRPEGTTPLPGVLALHCHSHFTYFGKEKIADGPDTPHTSVRALRDEMYSGTAWANELARRGFVVLVHDVLMWGSRRFTIPGLPEHAGIDAYNRASITHEHVVAKYAAALGTTIAAQVAREDRIALGVLDALPDVAATPLGVIGFSGGGLRSVMLNSATDRVGSAVVAGMMSTLPAMVAEHVTPHTWMLFPPRLPLIGDLPEVAAVRAPSPLLVQYGARDPLFPAHGRQAAHRTIAARYAERPEAYRGSFPDVGHEFGLAQQREAFEWLQSTLVGSPTA